MKQNKGILYIVLLAGILFFIDGLYKGADGGILDWAGLLVGIFMIGASIYRLKKPVTKAPSDNVKLVINALVLLMIVAVLFTAIRAYLR